jgi:hypothetical protein
MSVLKRMTDKFSHLGLQSSKSSSASGSSSLYVPTASSSRNPSVNAVLYSTDHRGSISTEATSTTGGSKSIALDAAAADAPGFPRKAAREKGTYRLNDFIIHRTLGMGSFGRVHLGESRSELVSPRQYLIYLQYGANTTSGSTPSRS